MSVCLCVWKDLNMSFNYVNKNLQNSAQVLRNLNHLTQVLANSNNIIYIHTNMSNWEPLFWNWSKIFILFKPLCWLRYKGLKALYMISTYLWIELNHNGQWRLNGSQNVNKIYSKSESKIDRQTCGKLRRVQCICHSRWDYVLVLIFFYTFFMR